MPFFKDEKGTLLFMPQYLWEHAIKIQPGLKEVIPEPIKYGEEEKQELTYTPINSLECVEHADKSIKKITRNVSAANKQQKKTHRKVR